jgi:hypothetical protein
MAVARRHHHSHRSVTHRATRHAASHGRKAKVKHSVHHAVHHHHGKKGHTITRITTTAHSRTVGKAGSARKTRPAGRRRGGSARRSSIGVGGRSRTRAAQFPAFPTGFPTSLGGL